MMPQELMQMDADQLLVLRAGLPPVRGRKILYWRERAFTTRVVPPPIVAAHPGIGAGSAAIAPRVAAAAGPDDLTLALVIPALAEAGLEPLPAEGASDAEVEAWVERFIDASAKRPQEEIDHGR
jgi:type IV secretion system protein VirD4